MFGRNHSVKKFADVLILALVFQGFSIGFVVDPCLGIQAAPGQAIQDYISVYYGGNYIEITVPTFPQLQLNPEISQPQTFRSISPLIVDSGGWWEIIVSSDVNGGRMAEYDPSSAPRYIPNGLKLQNPLQISIDNANYVDLSKGGSLVEGHDTGQPQPYDVWLKQDVTWQDSPLSDPELYRMEISFMVSGFA